MNDRDRNDGYAVDGPFEDEAAAAPPAAPDAKAAFGREIAEAFDRMGPTGAAEDRMLAVLLAAYGDGAAGDPAGRAARSGTGRGRRCPRARKALLPAAACLALLAGMGALASVGSTAGQLNGGSQEAAGAAGGGAASSAGKSAGASDGAASRDDAEALDAMLGDASGDAPQASQGDDAEASSGGSADASAFGGGADADARYPFVTLASGQALRVAVDDAGRPLVADPALVGAEIEQAAASDGTGERAVACTVLASASDAHPYAVRYPGDDACYWADDAA